MNKRDVYSIKKMKNMKIWNNHEITYRIQILLKSMKKLFLLMRTILSDLAKIREFLTFRFFLSFLSFSRIFAKSSQILSIFWQKFGNFWHFSMNLTFQVSQTLKFFQGQNQKFLILIWSTGSAHFSKKIEKVTEKKSVHWIFFWLKWDLNETSFQNFSWEKGWSI